ncbi:hypothetical protein O3P69_004485 [Scylla paramamosain]|uniref:Uncharacterized protein n=2 Tax=Scylla paramamosain TaxID=85552 RepID=A0AAW0UDE6_SCYPA
MDEEEREAATTRREYHTLLREIQALMSEVQRQRNDFRSELRSLTSTIIRRHNSTSARPCVCSAPRKTSRLPVMMSEQDAAKEVKKAEKAKEEKPKDEVKEDKKEEREEGRVSRASAGTSTPEPKPEENGDDSGTPKAITLKEQFRNFSKFGDTKSDGKMMTLSQADKWFKQAKVIDGKTITTTDTAITFNKFKTKKITFTEFEKYLDEISKSKKVDAGSIRNKLKDCGAPGTSGTTSVVKSSAVDRLTDTKKFTGSHKLRFDATGRGKGIAGRKDVPDGSGYVSGYKNKNTYDKTH